MKKIAVLALVALALMVMSGVASAERGSQDIGGVGVTRVSPSVR